MWGNRPGRLAPALIAGLLASTSCYAAPPLLLTFKNDTGHAGIYVGFVGGADVVLDAKIVATGERLKVSKFETPHWYRIESLKSGVSLTKFNGGRIYVGFGKPWKFEHAGYEPSPTDTTSTNYPLRFDKMEMTYTGAAADVADTTSIDYFGIPLALNVYQGGLSGTLVGSVTGVATDKVVPRLGAVTVPARAAIVRKPDNEFVRVIGPGVYPPSPGLPASPYNNLKAYLTYLRDTYAPANNNIVATIKGHFAGVGKNPTTPQTMPQDYDFKAKISSSLDVTLTGSATVVGAHTVKMTHADLLAPSGIYGANPLFSLDGASPTSPANDIYGWIIGDLLAGLNVGAAGSTVVVGGNEVGKMNSQDWFKLTSFFEKLQPKHKIFYNRWAATLAPLSQAYNFAYSDRFAHVFATLNPAKVDTLQIVFLNDRAQGQ